MRDPARLEQFMDAMSGISMGNFAAFAEKFDFSQYKTWPNWRRDRAAVGHRRRAASAHAMPSCDLPEVQPIANGECGAQSRRPGQRGDDRLFRG